MRLRQINPVLLQSRRISGLNNNLLLFSKHHKCQSSHRRLALRWWPKLLAITNWWSRSSAVWCKLRRPPSDRHSPIRIHSVGAGTKKPPRVKALSKILMGYDEQQTSEMTFITRFGAYLHCTAINSLTFLEICVWFKKNQKWAINLLRGISGYYQIDISDEQKSFMDEQSMHIIISVFVCELHIFWKKGKNW